MTANGRISGNDAARAAGATVRQHHELSDVGAERPSRATRPERRRASTARRSPPRRHARWRTGPRASAISLRSPIQPPSLASRSAPRRRSCAGLTARTTLIGDAIHAMAPYRGIGANVALKDAVRLRDALVAAQRGDAPLVGAIPRYASAMRLRHPGGAQLARGDAAGDRPGPDRAGALTHRLPRHRSAAASVIRVMGGDLCTRKIRSLSRSISVPALGSGSRRHVPSMEI
jgi:2-polyprenyl-6-methoxyphenol hydroxylase-like FAD-dependent oxidoreductase